MLAVVEDEDGRPLAEELDEPVHRVVGDLLPTRFVAPGNPPVAIFHPRQDCPCVTGRLLGRILTAIYVPCICIEIVCTTSQSRGAPRQPVESRCTIDAHGY